jgi:site-specific recombinase XerD
VTILSFISPRKKANCERLFQRAYYQNCHQLRHTAATLLLNAGAPIVAVQAILGHKKIGTTLIYARLYDDTVATDYGNRTDCSAMTHGWV